MKKTVFSTVAALAIFAGGFTSTTVMAADTDTDATQGTFTVQEGDLTVSFAASTWNAGTINLTDVAKGDNTFSALAAPALTVTNGKGTGYTVNYTVEATDGSAINTEAHSAIANVTVAALSTETATPVVVDNLSLDATKYLADSAAVQGIELTAQATPDLTKLAK